MVKKCTGHETNHSHQWHPSVPTGKNTPRNINNNLSVIACHNGNQNTHFWRTLKVIGKKSLLHFFPQGCQGVNSTLLSSPIFKQSVSLWQKLSTHFTRIIKLKKKKQKNKKYTLNTRLVHHQDLITFSSLFIPGVTSWTKAFSYHTIHMALLSVCPQLKASSSPLFSHSMFSCQSLMQVGKTVMSALKKRKF